jgi:hypothetical protein
MHRYFKKKFVIGGLILAVCLCVVFYLGRKAPRNIEPLVAPSPVPTTGSQTPASPALDQQKKAEALDRFTRLTKREEKLGITVTRGAPFIMTPPLADAKN